ncbi:hypothetical protein BRO07_06300 [Xanthomonas oryzae pv. oryzae]|nr:hypothetical protein BRO07_06300 [Xanthomonas oryzae pv. oryzae]
MAAHPGQAHAPTIRARRSPAPCPPPRRRAQRERAASAARREESATWRSSSDDGRSALEHGRT